ncbi:MAG: PKD domain-containing protein [Flavobacteriales bacterium]|nr:PKD domain-containing protein [Flavobacteriales bacterium]
MVGSAIHRVHTGFLKKHTALFVFLFSSLLIAPNQANANECNGVSLDVTIRDCYCISFQAFHNGHCYCTVEWNFGNGNIIQDNGCSVQKTECFAGPGTYTVSVYIDCPGGDCATSVTVVVPPENIQPDFTSSTVCETFCTQFTDFSTGDFQFWLWDFGDGNTSTQQNPCHLYAAGGIYNVNLEVSDSNGCEKDTTQFVQVYLRPTVDAGGFVAICDGGADTIGGNPTASTSPAPYFYIWSPSTALSCTTCANPIASPLATTTYSVTVSDLNGCIDSSTMLFQVNPNPTAIFSVDAPCLGTANTFTDQSLGLNVQWDWTFGDGGTDTLQNTTHLYFADGTYNASLVVTTDSGCTDTVTNPAIVDPLPQVDFFVANVCRYDPAVFIDLSTINNPGTNMTWDWDFGDGNTSTSQNTTHLYSAPGTYTIRLIVTSTDLCVDSLSKQLIIYPVPVAQFVTSNVCEYDTAFFTDQSTVSSGTNVAWNWDFDDGNLSTVQSPNNKYANPDTSYLVQLIVTTNFGCLDSITKKIVIHPKPVAAFTVDDTCVYITAVFTDLSTVPSGHPDSIISWIYDFGDNTIPVSAQGADTIHDYVMYDTVTVTQYIETDSSCKDTAWEQLIMHPAPVTWFVADTTQGCEPFLVDFSDSTTIPGNYNITGWDWDLGDGTTTTDQHPDPLLYFADNLYNQGTYDITLITTSDFGCIDTLSIAPMIFAWPLPVAIFTEGPNPSTILFPYVTFDNQSLTDTSGPTDYEWILDLYNLDDGFGYNTTSDSDYTHVYNNIDTGIYVSRLIVINSFGCRDTAYDSIHVKGDYILFIPNTFTPNNDGLNDFFYPQGIGFRDLLNYEFMIFDRWGDMIWKSDDVLYQWDGSANKGRFEAQQDVYVWLILTSDHAGVKHKYVGHVTLIR